MPSIDGAIEAVFIMPKIDLTNTQVAFAHVSTSDLRRYAFLFHMLQYRFWVEVGTHWLLRLQRWGIPVEGLVKKNLFRYFCGGETLAECRPTIHELQKSHVGCILDYAAEAQNGEAAHGEAFAHLKETVEFCQNVVGPGFFSVTKLSALCDFSQLETFTVWKETSDYARWFSILDAQAQAVEEAQGTLLIDAEESWIQDGIDAITLALMKAHNQKRAVVYITLQLYRHDRLAFLTHLLKQAQEEGFFVGIKLVRGAYMEKERARASQLGYPSPIYPTKVDTDRAYDAAIAMCFSPQGVSRVSLLLATHNEDSTQYLLSLLAERGIPSQDPHYGFSQLYGMSNPLSFGLALHGFHVYKYLPYGPVEKALPYLTRRAIENSAMRGSVNREYRWIRSELVRRR